MLSVLVVLQLLPFYFNHKCLVQCCLLLEGRVEPKPAENMLPRAISIGKTQILQNILELIESILALEPIQPELVLEYISQPTWSFLQVLLHSVEDFKVGDVCGEGLWAFWHLFGEGYLLGFEFLFQSFQFIGQ